MFPSQHVTRINILRLTVLMFIPFVMLTSPVWGYETFAHESIETLGIGLLLVGVLGRFWSILYIGSRKNQEVVQDGPYSLTRNPLYVFSTIAATGIGLMLGAFSFGILLGLTVGIILYETARREQKFLEREFGAAYARYAAEVPFFFPRFHGFRSDQKVTFDIRTLRGNMFDAFVFLAFIPLAELFDQLKLAMPEGFLFLY